MSLYDDHRSAPVLDADGGHHSGGMSEWDRLSFALAERFAPHQEAAAHEVNEAERAVEATREALAAAREVAASQGYHTDLRVFMRASLAEEVEALARKTTPKKVRVSYRYLVARATELAEAEIKGFRSDQADAQREREQSVAACVEAERQAVQRLEAALAMQRRVLDAEQTARDGLATMREKLSDEGESLSA